MPVQIFMTRYGLIRDGQIVSLFETDRPLSDFPDIRANLEVIPASAECNMVRDGLGGFKFTMRELGAKEQRRQTYVSQLDLLLADATVTGRVKTLVQALRDKEG